MSLTVKTKKKILKNVRVNILKRHFNVSNIDYGRWEQKFNEVAKLLVNANAEAFESGIQELLSELKSSHTKLFHAQPSQLLPQHTINATMGSVTTTDPPRWFFKDVFDSGPAQKAGIRPGDLLLRVGGNEYNPPQMPPFGTGITQNLSIAKPSSPDLSSELFVSVPRRRGNRNVPPILPPKSLSSSILEGHVGVLRVSWFPGSMGLSFSIELDRHIDQLKREGCDHLIIDLRGNIGGGLGFARLASYLCAGQIPIGYSVTPKRQKTGYLSQNLEKVVYPGSRVGFAVTLSRFALRDKSITLMTQGLGVQPFHGRIAIMVNEWTNSAAEMLAGFATENGLAAIVGVSTPGNVLGAINVRVGGGYWLRLPVFGWYTSAGKCLEGNGIDPDVPMDVEPKELESGVDSQMRAALRWLQAPLLTGTKKKTRTAAQ